MDQLNSDEADFQRLIAAFPEGELRECRVFAPDGTTYVAYFTDLRWLVEEVIPPVEQGNANAYVTLNDIDPKSVNDALHQFRRSSFATADKNILRRSRILLDFDPIREANTSSTDNEKGAARSRLEDVKAGLTKLGWPAEPLYVADSGNGYHAVYPVDLPNTPEITLLLSKVLKGLAAQTDTDRVSIDTKVFNPSRITTLYGTTKHKGEDTTERPHRRSRILKVSESPEPVSLSALEAVAAFAPVEESFREAAASYDGPKGAGIDLPTWLAEYDVPIARLRTYPWWRAGENVTVYELKTCPFNDHDRGQAAVWQTSDGMLHAHCFHHRCQGYGWRDLRAAFEPGYWRGTVLIRETPPSESIPIDPPGDPIGEKIE